MNNPITVSTINIDANSVAAAAAVNQAAQTTNLTALGSLMGVADGVAALVAQRTSAGVSSTANNNSAIATVPLFQTGNVAVTDNAISAVAGLNSSQQTILGQSPVGYVPTAIANASATLTTPEAGSPTAVTSTATGTIAVLTDQATRSDNSYAASADNNAVSVRADSFTTSNTVTGSILVDGNSIDARFNGNNASSSIDDLASATGQLRGTAVIATQQQFDGSQASEGLARAQTNQITASALSATTIMSSSVTVSDNSIGTTAAGNTAASELTLADNQSFAGTVAANTASTTFSATNPAPTLSNQADLVISTNQVVARPNANTPNLRSVNNAATISIDAARINGAELSLERNAITSQVAANTVDNRLASGENSALFDGTASVASAQRSDGALVDATIESSRLTVQAGTPGQGASPLNTSVVVASNTASASATGNRAANSASLDAVQLPLNPEVASLTLDTTPVPSDAYTRANGSALVSSSQLSNMGSVSAANANTIALTSAAMDSTTGSSLTIGGVGAGNTQSADALANTANNSLALTGTSVGTGGGVSSLQLSSTDTMSLLEGYLNLSISGGLGATGAASTALVANNTQRASSIAAQASNSLVANAVTLQAAAANVTVPVPAIRIVPGTTTFDDGLMSPPQVEAGLAVLNSQRVSGLIDSAATPGINPNFIRNGANGSVVGGSSLAIESNAVLVATQGANAANSADVSATSLGVAGNAFNSLAAVGNAQVLDGSSSVSASVRPNMSASILADVTGSVVDSQVRNSANTLAAQAQGLVASNTLLANATTLQAGDPASTQASALRPTGGVIAGVQASGSAFSVGNAQLSRGNVSASLRGVAPVAIETTIGQAVTNASVTSNGNLESAIVEANRATNTLGLGYDSASLTTGAGIASLQAGATLANAQTVMGSNLSASAGQTQQGDVNLGGVAIRVGRTIASSEVAVDGNVTQGAVTANRAVNTLAVRATNISAGTTGIAARSAVVTPLLDGSVATADFALANTQFSVVDNSNLNALVTPSVNVDVRGSFLIDSNLNQDITDSRVGITNNRQIAEGTVNTASNSLMIEANAVDPVLGVSGALASTQRKVGTVNVTSDADVRSNIGSVNSTVMLDNNSSVATGRANNAVNTLAVDGTLVGPATANSANINRNTGTVSADFALANLQTSGGGLTTTANLDVFNEDTGGTGISGIEGGTVSVSGNVALADSTANRSVNQLSVSGASSQTASAGIGNDQRSSGPVTANASSMYQLVATGSSREALDRASVSLAGNETTSVARGNSANNTLNYTAGASYGVSATQASATRGNLGATANAQAAVLNTQENTGAIAANANGVRAQVVLNGGPSPAAVLNASVNVTGNSTNAFAFGNAANNAVTVGSVSTGMPRVAVMSFQTNSGSVTAQANGGQYGTIVPQGTVGGSSVGVTSNAVTAQAVGNSSVSSIGAR